MQEGENKPNERQGLKPRSEKEISLENASVAAQRILDALKLLPEKYQHVREEAENPWHGPDCPLTDAEVLGFIANKHNESTEATDGRPQVNVIPDPDNPGNLSVYYITKEGPIYVVPVNIASRVVGSTGEADTVVVVHRVNSMSQEFEDDRDRDLAAYRLLSCGHNHEDYLDTEVRQSSLTSRTGKPEQTSYTVNVTKSTAVFTPETTS